MFHIFPAHTDPTVCNPEFIQNILTVTRNLCHISIYGSIFFIVFDCVAKQIHHNSLQLKRIPFQHSMLHIFPVLAVYNSSFFQLSLHQYCHFFHKIFQIKRFFMHCQMSRFKLTHIKYIIHQIHQMSCRNLDLIYRIFQLLLIVPALSDHMYHSQDSIDRGSQIMTHTIHEFCLCLTFHICLFIGNLQLFFFFLILFVEFRSIPEHNDSANHCMLPFFLVIIDCILRHQHCLLDPDFFSVFVAFLIFHSHLLLTGIKTIQKTL